MIDITKKARQSNQGQSGFILITLNYIIQSMGDLHYTRIYDVLRLKQNE